ncbi:MAG: ArsR/SmtB family transcription factor [Thermomicrobiales bacterium]
MTVDYPTHERGIAAIAHAFGDEGRVRILMALQDGRALPATRLAMEAGVGASTASVHLRKLVEAGLLKEVPPPPHHGRHRFFTLASAEVAELCESFSALVPPAPVRSLQPGRREAAMRAARTCYDHLAGRLSVAMMDALLAQQIVVPHDAGFAIGPKGEVAFERFGVDLHALRAKKRPLIRHCTDWSEQRPHLSGGLGSALLEQFDHRGWILRSATDRVVTVTAAGQSGFRSWIDLDISAIDTLVFAAP